MARLRNISTGVEVDIADDVAGNLSRWEWESADTPAPTTAADKSTRKPAKASPKPAQQ